MGRKLTIVALLLVTVAMAPLSADAWIRTPATRFASLPAGSTGPEGLTVGSDGNIYVTTFGFNTSGPVGGAGQLFVFDSSGRLLRQVSIAGSSSHLLGLGFNPINGDLLVIDFGSSNVRKVDPLTGASAVFMTVPNPGAAGLNALTFDGAGRVYVSDSFQGTIWRVGPGGGLAASWVTDATLTTTGVPPFGANGVAFNNAGTALFVANTGNDTVVKIPVAGGAAGTPAVFTNSINGADGLVIDKDDNIWVCANQADEIVVLDPTGRVIAKLGDFDGIDSHGAAKGLLFPASLAFGGEFLYVTNLALDLRLFGLAQSVDSQWTQQVTTYTVSKIPVHLPPIQGLP